MLASFILTALYHFGYNEFQYKTVFGTVFGNEAMSLAFFLTMNPLAAILPQVAIHITVMINGWKTTGQVPSHYYKG